MDAFKKASTAQPEKPVIDLKSNGPMGSTYNTGAFDPIERPAPTSTPQADSQVTGVTDLGDAGMRSADDGGGAAQPGLLDGQVAVASPADMGVPDTRRLLEDIYSGEGGAIDGVDAELVAAVRLLPQEQVMGSLDGAVIAPEPSGSENVAQEVDLGALANQMLSNILKTQADVAKDQARNVRAREITPEEDSGPAEPGLADGPNAMASTTAEAGGAPVAAPVAEGSQAHSDASGADAAEGEAPASMLSWGTSRRVSDSRLRRDEADDDVEDDESSTLLQLTPSQPGEGLKPGAGGSADSELGDFEGDADVDDDEDVDI
jgi:hypothetical protein